MIDDNIKKEVPNQPIVIFCVKQDYQKQLFIKIADIEDQ
jgi:hypothetical protein